MSHTSLTLRLLILGLLAPFIAASVVHAQPPAVSAVPAEWTLAANDLGVLSRVYPSIGFTLPADISVEDSNTAQAVYRTWINETDILGVFTAELSGDREATQLLEGFVASIDPTPCGATPPKNVSIGCSGNRQYAWWQAGDRVNVVFSSEPTAFNGLMSFQLDLGTASEPVIPTNPFATMFRAIVALGLLGLFGLLVTRIRRTIRRNQDSSSYKTSADRATDALLATQPKSDTVLATAPVPTPPPAPGAGTDAAPTAGPSTVVPPPPTALSATPPAALSEFFDVNALETNNFSDDSFDAGLAIPGTEPMGLGALIGEEAAMTYDPSILGPNPIEPGSVAPSAAEPIDEHVPVEEELPELVFDRPFPSHRMDEAAASPEGWVFDIDPSFDTSGDVPPEAILGAWAIDAAGQPTGEYLINPREGVSS